MPSFTTRRSPTATNKTAQVGAEPGTAIGNQGSDGGPAGGGPAAKKPEGTGQMRSKERGSQTRSKKQPGKRAHLGGSSA